VSATPASLSGLEDDTNADPKDPFEPLIVRLERPVLGILSGPLGDPAPLVNGLAAPLLAGPVGYEESY